MYVILERPRGSRAVKIAQHISIQFPTSRPPSSAWVCRVYHQVSVPSSEKCDENKHEKKKMLLFADSVLRWKCGRHSSWLPLGLKASKLDSNTSLPVTRESQELYTAWCVLIWILLKPAVLTTKSTKRHAGCDAFFEIYKIIYSPVVNCCAGIWAYVTTF